MLHDHAAPQPTQNVVKLIRTALPELRKSEARVDSTVAEVTELTDVSQPTVIRFCVAIGFSGFEELKLRLAQGLALGRAATHSVIPDTDSLASVTNKIFEYTHTSLGWALQRLDKGALERSVNPLELVNSIEFFGYVASGIVALDARRSGGRSVSLTRPALGVLQARAWPGYVLKLDKFGSMRRQILQRTTTLKFAAGR